MLNFTVFSSAWTVTWQVSRITDLWMSWYSFMSRSSVFVCSVLLVFQVWLQINFGRVHLKPDGTRWCTGREAKGKLANGVGSQYSHTTSERGVSNITNADAHTSAAPTDLNGFVHFGERQNLVSARVPSRFECTILHICSFLHELFAFVWLCRL